MNLDLWNRPIGILCGLMTLVLCNSARAEFDSEGWISFDFLAEPDTHFENIDQVPKDAPFAGAYTRAYLSSAASDFGEEDGLLVWAFFKLESPDGLRVGSIVIDVDLSGGSVLSHQAATVKIDYYEKLDGLMLYEGKTVEAVIEIDALRYGQDELDGIEVSFYFLLVSALGGHTGSRVFLHGQFRTRHWPEIESNPSHSGGDYVETGCAAESDPYYDDHYDDTGCGGDEYDSSGCESSDYDSSSDSGCEGDSYDSGSDSGCESDSYDSGSSDSASCEGDSYDSGSDCEGDAYASVRSERKRRSTPLRAIMRLMPEIVGIAFIAWMKRRCRYQPGRK